MSRQRIEPRFDDDRLPERRDRFVAERRARAIERQPSPEYEDAADSTPIYRRLAWMVLFVGVLFLAWESLKWYAEASDSPQLGQHIESLQQDLAAARQRMLNLPIRHIVGSSVSARGRELRRQCEELSRAFVANPQPRARELMLEYCQGYEQYQSTGKIPRDLPDIN